VYVVFGSPAGFPDKLSAADLNGSNGFRILGEAPGDRLGLSVSGGDVNGDGLGDILIGAPQQNAAGEFSGAAYLVLGRATFPATLPLTVGSPGVTKFIGEATGDLAGFSVSATGDFDGNGLNDILIGAPNAAGPSQTPGAGAAYLIYGSSFLPTQFGLGTLNGNNGYKIQGLSAEDNAGTSVSFVGDVDKDGFGDIAIGAPQATTASLHDGSVFVVFGRSSDIVIPITLNNLNGTNGFRLNGEGAEARAGTDVSAAGDLDGDTFADFVVGAPGAGAGDQSGAAYVVYGKPTFPAAIDLSSIAGSLGFKIVGRAGDLLGYSVRAAGDFNGDGLGDLIVGAPGAFGGAGGAYLLLGSATGFTDMVEAAKLDGTIGFALRGALANDTAGASVSFAGDVNRDGFGDLIIGAPFAATGGANAGAAYVVYGLDTRVTIDPSGNAITITEADGDIVTLQLSQSGLSPRDIVLAPDGSIRSLDLTRFAPPSPIGGAFKLLNVAIGVKTPAGGIGDGFTKVGFLNADGVRLGKLKLQGDLGRLVAGLSGSGTAAKSILISGNLGTVTGSVGLSQIFGPVGKFTVRGDLLEDSVEVAGKVKSLKIAGDYVGDPTITTETLAKIADEGFSSDTDNLGVIPGGVFRADGIGKLKIGLNMKGGGIATAKNIGLFSVNGDVVRGNIFGGGGIKTLKVLGKITSDDPGEPVNITARNQIGTLVVNHDVENARILAGYTSNTDPVNPDAKIGKILVKGNWIASSVAAGIEDSTNDGFGRNDVVISGDTTDVISKIGSVIVKGTASGTAVGTDHFGITAQQIGKVSIDGVLVALTSGTDDILIDTTNNDFRVVEI
jgi:hypothetical protein